VWLPQAQLKRSRNPRSEFTLHPETAKYLDIVLEGLSDDDKVFNFGYRQSLKFFDSACKRAKVVCEVTKRKASWKDLRSGMVIYLFNNGWNSDDINLRLGHNVTSKELEAYFSYAGANGKRAKKSHINNSLQEVKEEMEETKKREKYNIQKMKEMEKKIEILMGMNVPTGTRIRDLPQQYKQIESNLIYEIENEM